MIKIHRLDEGDRSFQTLGTLTVILNGNEALKLYSLELPWLGNKPFVSCIPNGSYKAIKRTSERFGEHFHILDVPNRDHILIHIGNFKRDVQGCILAGLGISDIDGDGHLDVVNSGAAMKNMLSLLPDKFDIEITSEFPLECFEN